MSNDLQNALWWALAFVAIAVTIAAGVRIVDWISMGEAGPGPQVWRTALVFVGGATIGGTALTVINRNGAEAPPPDDDLHTLT